MTYFLGLLFPRGAWIPLGPGCGLSSSLLIRIVGVETPNATGGSDVRVTGVGLICDVDPRGGASSMALSLSEDEVCSGSSTWLPSRMMLNYRTFSALIPVHDGNKVGVG